MPVEERYTEAKDITVSNWGIENVGQGILIRAESSLFPASGIVVSNVDSHDIEGNQILLVKRADDVAVNNLTCRNFDASTSDPTEPVGGITFENTTGNVSNVSVFDSVGSTFPMRVFGDSTSLQVTNVLFSGCDGGVLYVGPEGSAADMANVVFSNFTFVDVAREPSSFVLVTNSTGDVRFDNGRIDVPIAPVVPSVPITVRLLGDSEVGFEGCNFQRGNDQVFEFGAPGKAVGRTNSWNREVIDTTLNFSVHQESQLHVVATTPKTITLDPQALWPGNRIVVRDVTGATLDKIIITSAATIHGEDEITDSGGALLIRSDGTAWFLNVLEPPTP